MNKLSSLFSILPSFISKFCHLSFQQIVRFSTHSIWICLLFFFVTFSIKAAGLVNVPLGHEIYPFIDRMIAKCALPVSTQYSLPSTRGQVADSLLKISNKFESGELSLSRVEQMQLKSFIGEFAQECRKRGVEILPQQESKYFFSLKDKRYTLNIQPQLDQKIIIQQTDKNDWTMIPFLHPIIFGEIEEKFVYSTRYKWGPLISGEEYVLLSDESLQPAADFDQIISTESFAKVGLPWLSLELGKDDLWWGPGRHGSLVLSDNSDSKDLLKFEGHMGLFKLSSFTAILRSKLGHKYMSGHRLEVALLDNFCLALHETVVYEDRLELHYLNPFTIYLIVPPIIKYGPKENAELPGDNKISGGDIKYRITPNFELYGELMVDDYQPQLGSRSFRAWNSKFGVLLGAYYVNPFDLEDTDLRIEYVFVNQYAYTHESGINAYTNREHVIGHPIGSDADDIWIEFKYWFTDKIQTKLAYEFLRHGEGNANKFHQLDGPEEWEFLSGITESSHSLSLNLSYLSIGNYSFSADYRYSRIRNSKNRFSYNESEQQLVIEMEYRL